jgi:hypothetical protein
MATKTGYYAAGGFGLLSAMATTVISDVFTVKRCYCY